MKNLKKAVILSNHFRSFNYVKEYVRKFWGESTDFFISTWDYNYFYKTAEEVEDLKKHPDYIEELKKDTLDKDELKEDLESFNPHSYYIHTDNEFMEWASGFSDYGTLSRSRLLTKYGQLFSCIKGFELVKKSKVNYDCVIRTRLDCIQYLPDHSTWEKEFKKFDSSKKTRPRNNLMVEQFTIKEGFPWVTDAFFYGQPRTLDYLYCNVHSRINKINNSSIFTDNDLKEKLLFHKFFGSLILGSNIDIKFTTLRNIIIRKDHVVKNLDLNDVHDLTELTNSFTETKHKMRIQHGLD